VIQGCKEDGKNKKLDEDKKGVAKQKQDVFEWREGAYSVDSCCVFFRYGINYVMVGSVFCLELRLIKG